MQKKKLILNDEDGGSGLFDVLQDLKVVGELSLVVVCAAQSAASATVVHAGTMDLTSKSHIHQHTTLHHHPSPQLQQYWSQRKLQQQSILHLQCLHPLFEVL